MKIIKTKKPLFRLAVFAITFCMCLPLLAGCATNFNFYEENLGKYIKHGEYIGIEIEVVPDELTEDEKKRGSYKEIAQFQQDFISQYESYITDRAVADGDLTYIDFDGFVGDVAFEDGSAVNQYLMIGSGTFIPGFEEGLIGAMPGSTVDVNLTFPADYGNTELAGKAAKFVVTVHHIVPNLTDDFVAANSSFASVQLFVDDCVNRLAEQKKINVAESKKTNLWAILLEESEVLEYPEGLLSANISFLDRIQRNDPTTQYFMTAYGINFEEFLLEYYGQTIDEYNAANELSGSGLTHEQLLLYSIAKELDFPKITNDEYKTLLAEYSTNSGATEEQFEEFYGEDFIKYNILWEKVLEELVEKAVIKVIQ